MSNSGFVLAWDDVEARRRLQQLLERGTRVRPLLLEIGNDMVRSTLQRFEDQIDPDGNPWVQLRPATLARKRGSQILTERGYLRGGIAVLEATDVFVEVGADREYAAIHQFGGVPGMKDGVAKIPARAYLGISARDRESMERTVLAYF